jgi:hypothetical protein
MNWADTLSFDECKNVKLSELSQYKENWDVVKEIALSH